MALQNRLGLGHKRRAAHDIPGCYSNAGSWLNMVEIFFGITTRQAIRRGTFCSVHELTDAIRRFIDAYNDRAQPFVWTKTADHILTHASPRILTHASPRSSR